MINKDFKEFIELLNSNNVKYLIVGGYALAFHGYPRYTKDIDIWVWIERENAENIISALLQLLTAYLAIFVVQLLLLPLCMLWVLASLFKSRILNSFSEQIANRAL